MSPPLRTSLALLSMLWLPICTQAHMQMSSPYPLRSPLDPDVPVEDKDYSMTSPLLADGSNFPCKNYQNWSGGNVTKATYVSGGSYDMWLNGTIMHDGGSCQLSLSYDNGATFKVIKSMIGGCPLDPHFNFTIPQFAPSSDSALISWSWFNLIGNREMYQNCARVKIISAPAGRHRRAFPYRRQASSMDQLPDMFACNVGNGCQTIERREVVFPNPGDDVVYGQDAITPDPGPGYLIAGVSTTSDSSTATSSDSGSTSSTAVTTSSDPTLSSSSSQTTSSATTTSSASLEVEAVTTTDPASSLSTSSTAVTSSLTTTSTTSSSDSGTTSSESASTTDPSSSSTTSTSSLTSTLMPTSSSTVSSATFDLTAGDFLPTTFSSSTSSDFYSTSVSTTTSSMSALTLPASTSTSSSTSDIVTDGMFFPISFTTVSASATVLPSYPILNITVVPMPLPTGTGYWDNYGTASMNSSFFTNWTTATPTSTTTTWFSTSSSLTTESTVTSSTTYSTSSTTSSGYQTTSITIDTDLFSTFAPFFIPTTSSTTMPTTFLTSIQSTTTSSPSATAAALALACVPGTFTCDTPSSFSQCISSPSSPNGSTYVYMGSVAPGTTCADGQIIRQNAGACTPSGQLFCNGEGAFYLCDEGGLIDMGPVAPGTACKDGVIGYA